MATHSSVLAWRILGTGEPGGLPSMGSHRVGHDWSDLAAAAAAAVHVCERYFPTCPTLPLPHCVHSLQVCLFLPSKQLCLYHFSRFHVDVLIYNICFSPPDLLYCVWQTLGPSTSLQMTQFHSFSWLSNSPLYICSTPSLSIPLLMNIYVASIFWLM